MKSPEELAYDYGEKFDNVEISKNDINIAWYEGYKAAQEHAHAALEEAEAKIQELQDQLADADKVMPDTCEHILDMSKMVDVNGWISVKDGRPEPEKVVLAYNPTMFGVTTAVRSVVNHWLLTQPAFGTTLGINGKPPVVTHWQPLPEPPKEEG